jgi:hypothetical protein
MRMRRSPRSFASGIGNRAGCRLRVSVVTRGAMIPGFSTPSGSKVRRTADVGRPRARSHRRSGQPLVMRDRLSVARSRSMMPWISAASRIGTTHRDAPRSSVACAQPPAPSTALDARTRPCQARRKGTETKIAADAAVPAFGAAPVGVHRASAPNVATDRSAARTNFVAASPRLTVCPSDDAMPVSRSISAASGAKGWREATAGRATSASAPPPDDGEGAVDLGARGVAW